MIIVVTTRQIQTDQYVVNTNIRNKHYFIINSIGG